MSASSAVVDGGEGDGRHSTRAADPLARAVFALLVLACFAAFFLTQTLKHSPTAVQRFELTSSFEPSASGPAALAGISFKLARADAVTVSIINRSGDVVATLVRDYPAPRYKQFSLRWNGREGDARLRITHTARGHAIVIAEGRGRLAAAGEYRARVSLRQQHRTVFSPRAFTLIGP